MKRIPFLLALFYFINHLNAQNLYIITGKILDTTGQEVIGANILLTTSKDSFHTTTNENGVFLLSGINLNIFTVKVSSIGYITYSNEFRITESTNGKIQLPDIKLKIKNNILKEIVIKGKSSPLIVKEDTIEYNIDNIKLREDAVVEDLLKRLPGLTLDRNGNILYMGNQISKLQTNGQEFAINDIKTLIQLLPKDMLEKVKIIEDYGYLAKITGRKSTSPTYIISLQTKNKIDKTQFTQVIAGLGTQNRYNAMANLGYNTTKNKFFFSGGSNNTGSTIGEQITNNWMGNYSTKVNGLNLRTNFTWEKILNKTESSSIITTNTSEGISIQNNKNQSDKNNQVYSLFLSGDYTSIQKDILNFMLKGSMLNSTESSIVTSKQSGIQLLNQDMNNNIAEKTPSLDGYIFFSHIFKNPGKILSGNLSINYLNNQNHINNLNKIQYLKSDTTNIDSNYHQIIDKQNEHLGLTYTISYIEPINPNTNVELRYNLNTVTNNNTLETYLIDNNENKYKLDSLSNKYNYNTQIHELGLSLLHKYKTIELIIGANGNKFQINTGSLTSAHNHLTGYIFVPFTRLELKLGKTNKAIVSYNTSISLPTYQQTQPTIDKTNIQFPVIGNPNLKASTSNNFSMEYRHLSNTMLIARIKGSLFNNKIVTNTILVNDSIGNIVQETHFLNSNGAYYLEASYEGSKALNNNKLLFSLFGNNSYLNNITFLQNEKKYVKIFSSMNAFKVSTFQRFIEMGSEIGCTWNYAKSEIEENKTTNIITWNFIYNSKFFVSKSLFLYVDISKQYNNNINNIGKNNPLNLNMAIEKSFFKSKLIGKLHGYNLTNETSNVSQTVMTNIITQTKSNVFGKYFLLSITYNFRKITTH